MTLPPWITPPDDDDQRVIDEKLAARMGITVERLHEIDRQMAEDVRARDAIPPTERVVDGNPKFNKGFGPLTSENRIEPGEIRAHEKLPLPPPPPPRRQRVDYNVSRHEIATDDDLRLTFRGEPFTGEVVETIGDQLLAQSFYVDGVPHGADREWWASGRLKSEGYVNCGRAEGIWRSWRHDGQLECEKEFDATGGLIAARTWDEDGNRIDG